MENDDKNVYLVTNAIVEGAEEGIDLQKLLAPIKTYIKLVSICAVVIIAVGAFLVLRLSEEYAIQTKLMHAQKRYMASESSGIGSALSGASSLLGLGGGGDMNQSRNLEISKSSVVVEAFIIKNDILELIFAEEWDENKKEWIKDSNGDVPTLRDGYEEFIDSIFSINEDANSGVITLTMAWRDAEIASQWGLDYVKFINEYLRSEEEEKIENSILYLEKQLLQTTVKERRDILFNLIEKEVYRRVSVNVEDEFAFSVVDPLVVITNEGLKRKILLMFVVIVLGAVGGIFTAYLVQIFKKEKTH